MSKELEVSLVNYLCPVCGNIAEEGIIMNSLLSEEAAKKDDKPDEPVDESDSSTSSDDKVSK